MAKDERTSSGGGIEWIFAAADPRTLPTDRLPGLDEVDAYAEGRGADGAAEGASAGDDPQSARPSGSPVADGIIRRTAETVARERHDSDTSHATHAAAGASGGRLAARPVPPVGPAPDFGPHGDESPVLPERSFARSGTTPNAEERDRAPVVPLPSRFAALNGWDALRDGLALVCLIGGMTTQLTGRAYSEDATPLVAVLETVTRIAVGLSLTGLVAVHLGRWIPANPPLRTLRVVRMASMSLSLLAALAVIVADLVTGLPVLFASLPDGPPVGVGVGTALLVAGSLVGMEPRRHEGAIAPPAAPLLVRRTLRSLLAVAGVFYLLSWVMVIGRVATTGWAYSLLAAASAAVSMLVVMLVIRAGVGRDRSRYVFSAAMVAGLLLGALADNSLRLNFASAQSVATGFVYLPWLFAALAVMVSRTAVRAVRLTFRRVDWVVHTLRAFEISAVLHAAAVVWAVLAAIAALGGAAVAPVALLIVDAAVALVFVVVSLFARRSLLERPAATARAAAVVAAVVMIVVGFLDIIVNSLATGAGAGLMTGGVALAVGLAAGLMLTVPAPVRDEYGAPDLGRMFEEFRARNGGDRTLASRVPDVSAERARRKVFPAGSGR
ncbi:hypothetical protein JSY14_08385 [Brachybacterium sp. EF45031]|uniref:DUF7937 domain-containing protein n=1 Tax=Brachybacterium sillae TaxID=2810536 RepID=UPI00217DCA69|nr:hypothetical protein [Brachybacterium sillae]MCS6712035.1 hypothetical protein [Brachybacterium sillae]